MVIEAEFYPQNGLLKHHGSSAYTEEYYQNPHKTYGHKEDYTKQDFYNNSSTITVRPTAYITAPHQPTKHGFVNHEGYSNYQDNSYGGHAPTTHKPQDSHTYANYQDNSYGGHAPEKHKAQDGHSYAKYLNGMNHGEEGYNSYTQPPPPAGYYGQGKGKQMKHHNNGGYDYETQQYETYTEMGVGPNRYETASYDYYGESPYNVQPHKQKKNWATTGAEWISKGV